MDNLSKLQNLIDRSNKIVFFGGAGVSTESGLKDFRSADGLYAQRYAYPPEFMLSHTCWAKMPEEFYKFYKDKLSVSGIKPNAAHYKLAELEKAGKLLAVVTQNIDGLHQAAGSKRVYELHGSVHRNYCVKCGKSYTYEELFNMNGIPKCSCGGIVKPDVVLYEEPLNDQVLNGAISAVSEADLLIIAGTSLAVYPAASLIDFYKGEDIVIINRSPTPADSKASLVIKGKVGEVLNKIKV